MEPAIVQKYNFELKKKNNFPSFNILADTSKDFSSNWNYCESMMILKT